MKIHHILFSLSLSLSLVSEVLADDAMLRVRALRAARKMAATAPSAEVTTMKKNTTFDGIWGGRYIYSPRSSTCGTRLSSFDFRHVFLTKKGSGYLYTNHDGDFTGRSRDKGRKWEFVKGVTVGGRPAALAVVYQNLAKNGNSAATGVAIVITGGCTISYGANSIRLAK